MPIGEARWSDSEWVIPWRIEVTTRIGCNVACSYCPQSTLVRAYRGNSGHQTSVLSLDLFACLTSSVPANVDIHFSGFSEPFHASDCVAMIQLAFRRGHSVSVFTTADRLRLEDVDELRHLPFKRFMVHLPDRDGEMRLAIAPSYLEVLKALQKAGIQGLEFMTLGQSHPAIEALKIDTNPSTRIHSRAGNLVNIPTSVSTAYSKEDIERRTMSTSLVCRRDRVFANVLLPNGLLYLCCMDYGLQHSLGDLSKQNYSDIVGGPAIREVLRKLLEPDSSLLCRSCEYAVPGRYHLFPDATTTI